MSSAEKCEKPFKNRKCGIYPVKVYITLKGKEIPMCENCFNKMVDKDQGVTVEEPQPINIEEEE